MRVFKFVATVGVAALVSVATAGAALSATPKGSDKKFCEAVVDISVLFGGIDDEPTPDQQEEIGTLLAAIEKHAPADLESQAALVGVEVPKGNVESPEVSAAITEIDDWVAGNCGYQVIDVTARDYEFEGMPETLKTGTTILRFTNEGTELHEVSVMRIKGKESIHELLELPEDEGRAKVESVGTGFAPPGDTSIAYVQITKPGNYAAVCFIPVGSTSFEAAESAAGPPHFAEGMVTEFTVKGKKK